jgi:hypothetical protein
MRGSLILPGADGSYLSWSTETFERRGGPRPDDFYDMAFTVALVADGEETSVLANMIEPYRRDTLGFFQSIARPRWAGSDSWESEYAEVAISARSDGSGAIDLDVTLRWNGYESSLARTLRVRGDDLAQFSSDIARFLHVDEGARFQSFALPKRRRGRR